MSVPPPPSSSPFNSISSPRRYLRSRTRTSSIDFVPQSAVAGPARSPVGASSAPPAIANASPPLPPANTSPTRPLIPSYDPNNVPYTPPYGLGSGGPVSFPPTSPPMSVATGYTPTSPLALESPSSPSIGRPSSRVRPVSFGLPARSEDQGSPYSPLVQPDYVPREENSSQVPLQRGPFEPPPPVPRTQNRKFSTSSAGSQIGAPRDADESASGRPLSPQSSAGVSPVRRQTSFHIPAPPSIVPGKGAAGGVAQFSLGLGPRPQSQSQVESPRAPVPNLFRPVTSTMAALGLGEARTRKDADIPSKPSISTSNSTRTNPPDNAVTWKENPLVSNGLGLKTQSPGTVLFQTAHGLVDTLLPGITSPFHDESNRSETKEPPTLNDSPSSISLTVLSSPVISSSVALDKVEPTLPEEVLPEISRNDNAGPGAVTAIKEPDDTSEDITSKHIPTSLISTGLPAPSESPVKSVVNGTSDVKEDTDHPVNVPSDKADYATSALASDDITTQHVPSSLPLLSSSPLSTLATIEETPVDAEIAVGPSPIVEEPVSVQPAAEPLTVGTERDTGSSSVPSVPPAFEEAPHDVEASTASESRALAPVETALPSGPVEQASINVSGPHEPEVDQHQIESSELGPAIPLDAETPLIVEEPGDMGPHHPTSEEHVPEPSSDPISDVLEVPAATTYVEEPSIGTVTPRPSDPETDLQLATSEKPVLNGPIPRDASVGDVAGDPVPSASAEPPRVVTSGPPNLEDNQAPIAFERPVLDSPTKLDAPVANVLKAIASDEQLRVVTPVLPDPDDNQAPVASEGSVLDSPANLDAPAVEVLKAPSSSASDEHSTVVTPRLPEPEYNVTPAASEGPVLDSPIYREPPVVDAAEAPAPNASKEQPRAITSGSPDPEDNQPPVVSERPVLDGPTNLDAPSADMFMVPPPSASDEQPRVVIPESESKVTPAASERPVLDIPTDREAPAIGVAKASPSTVSDERPRDVISGPPEPEENLAPVASERPVLDSPINLDTFVDDAAEASVNGASKEQPSRGAALEAPEPEGDVAPVASERPVLDIDTPTLRDTLVTDVVEAPEPSASDESPRAGPPEPVYDLTPTASERPILNTPINLEAPVINAAKVSPPGAPVEAVTPEPPKPEEAPVVNVAEVSLSTASDEQPGVLESGPPEPEVNLAPVASDLPVLDSAINLDSPAIDAAEASVNGASKEQPSRGVAPEDPKPEGDVAPVVSEGLALDSLTLQDTLVADLVEAAPSSSDEQFRTVTPRPPGSEEAPVIDVAKASPSSASVKQPRAVASGPPEPEEAPIIEVAEVSPSSTSIEKAGAVTPRPPEPENSLAPAASEIPVLDTPVDRGSPVIDVAEVSPSSAPVEQPRAITPGPPEAEDHLTPAAVLDTDTLVNDAVEAPLPSASEDQPRVVTSEPPEPEYNVAPAASERPVLDSPIGREPPVVDAAEALAPSASKEQPRAVASGSPDPEDNQPPVASERSVLDGPTNLDAPADLFKVPPPIASDEQPRVVMPEPESKVTPATSERPLLDIPIDREAPVIGVAKASPSTVSDEQPRDIRSGSLEPEENLAPVASERPVLDSPINSDAPVVDATETPVPSASKEQPSRGVALEGPEPDGDVAPVASERPVLDSPTLRDTLVADVVEAQAPSASDEQPRAVMPRPPEPDEAPVIDAAKASPPGAPVEAATPKPPKPEEAPVINVAEVSLSTASDELPRVLVSGPPEPEVNLAPVASDVPVLDSPINLDTPAIDAAEALVNGADKEQPSRGVAPEDPKPEGDVALVASEGPVLVLDSPTLQDTLVADVVEAPAPSASDEQSRAVTPGPPESEQAPVIDVAKASPSSPSVEQPRAVASGPPEPEEAPIIGVAELSPSSTSIEKASAITPRLPELENSLAPAASEIPVLDTPIDGEPPVIDVAEVSLPSAPVEQPRAITQGPPDAEDHLTPVAVLDTDTLVTDAVEAPLPSASEDQPRTVTSGSPGPEDGLGPAASEGPILDTPAIDVAEALLPSAPDEQHRTVAPGLPDLTPAASETPIVDTPVTDGAEAPVPSASVEHPRAVTPRGPEPESSLPPSVSVGTILGTPVADVVETSLPSAPDEPRAIAPGLPEPDDTLIPPSERPILDTPVINVAEAPVPSAPVEQPKAVTPGGPEPEESLAPTVSEGPILDTPDIDVSETSVSSAPDQPKAVTPGLPEPENTLTLTSSERPVLDTPGIDVAGAPVHSVPIEQPRAITPVDPESENDPAPAPSDPNVADVAEAPLPSASNEEPMAITPGPPDDPTPTASERPVLETPTHWDADVTDLPPAPQLSAPIEKPEIVPSGPANAEDGLGHTASDGQVSETSYPSDPRVSDVAEALVPGVHAGDDIVTPLDPPPAVDSPAPGMDESVSIAPVDTGTVLIPQNQGSAVEEPKPVMQIDPDPDFHGHEIVPHGPVAETSVESAPPETDVAEATPPSTGAEEDGIAFSGPSEPEATDREPLQVDLSAGAAAESPEHVGQFAPGPEIHASHTASDELKPETSGTPDRHTVDVIEAIPPGADAEEDNIAVSGTSETGVNLEDVALDSLVPEVLTTPDHKEDGLMAGSHGAETGVPAHFTADPELNTSYPPADEVIPIAPLNTDDRAHSDSDAEIPLHTDSNQPPPVAPLDAKILHTSAYEETSVQETEPSSNAPVPVDLGAVQSPDHGDILTRPVIDVEAIEWSVPADPIQVDNDAPPLALGSSPSLAGSSAPEAPVRHVGFASPVATTLDVDDATEISGEAEPEEPKEEGAAVQQHVTVTTSAEAISPDLSQPSSAPPLMTDTVTSPEIVSVENSGTSEVKVETPRMSLTPTNSELALNDGFEQAKLDKPLTSDTSDTTGYPSPPISDIGLASAPASGPGVEAEDEIAQLHALPRELTIDTDTLVRSPNPVRPTPGSPPSSRTHDTHWLQPRPPPRKNLTHGFVSLLYYFFPQIELASTIQTVPQSTGFFSIIGGFLIDMTFELTYLFWFFLSEVVFPRLHDLLRFTVLLVLSLFFSILGPFLGERGPSLHRKYTRPWIQGLQRSAPYYKERID